MSPRFFEYGPAATAWLARRDARLGAVIAQIGHIEREVDDGLFPAMVHHVIGQQIATKAQRTIWLRLQAMLGQVVPAAIGRATVEELQSCGMTFRKAGYIKEFAERVLAGAFDLAAVERMPDAEAIAALAGLRGLGVWTAEMILLFGLQRPDILSFGDLAIQRGLRMVYRRRAITPAEFGRCRRRLSPWGSVASLYFWAVAGGAIEGLTDPAPKKKA